MQYKVEFNEKNVIFIPIYFHLLTNRKYSAKSILFISSSYICYPSISHLQQQKFQQFTVIDML